MGTSNEWVTVELLGPNRDGEIRRYKIATGANVSQGQLLELTDDRTVVSATVGGPIAGVASEDHLAVNADDVISAYTQGLFRVVASQGILVGETLTPAGANNLNLVTSSGIITNWTGARSFDTVTDGQTLTVRLDV